VLKLAVVEIRRHIRVSARAWRKLLRRGIKPSVAFLVFVRSLGKISRIVARLMLLLIGGGMVGLLVLFTRIFYKLRNSQ